MGILKQTLAIPGRPSTYAVTVSPLRNYRDTALVAVLLTLPFFMLRANMKKPHELNAFDHALVRVSAPVATVVGGAMHAVGDVWRDYIALVGVRAEVERLAYDNARLREAVHRGERQKAENQELRRLLQLREATPGELVSAQVIGKNFTEFFRVTRVVLDRGAHDARDVRAHMPVIAPDGVVGSVLHVAGNSLDVELAVDSAFGIDVEDERTKARGFVRGTGDPTRYACKVEMVDARDEVEVGDLLVTSGKGRWFPRGLPVARVTKVVRRELGREQEVQAAPTVDFSRLDNVLIIVTPSGEDTLSLGADSKEVKPARGH